jgi:hypothetical protein
MVNCLDSRSLTWQRFPVKALAVLFALVLPLAATTISVVPVFEPLSMHGTDVDADISDIGEALQATVESRPMALTGAMPEVLIEAIRTPHRFPSNNPNYKVEEVNLLVICNIGITAEAREEGLHVALNVAQLAVPEPVDLTGRQVLKLALVAIRKTLEEYQRPQTEPLKVQVVIEGTDEGSASLSDLGTAYTLGEE